MPYFEDELVRLGDGLVCGRCKPLFVQKLREGVTPAGEMVYAGLWIRFGARIIDGMIIGAAGLVIMLVGWLIFGSPGTPSVTRMIATAIFQNLLYMGFAVAYTTYFLGKSGATPGKMACGLRVVRSDGEKITYARAFGRFFADWLNSFTIGIGYLIAAFDEEKRALHDRICDTRVVRQA